ncbi:hypothetical protein [Luteimonas sp. YGD11-2]|uniref:hypothetical protein n=1 Tax=Luteimonas sp. YGD11-2 TaxID=2508168 RepID=UPI00100B489C|nr:hypothetical protein [Luteimonas sp. YGD11-2]
MDRALWLHALCNEVNTAGIALCVAERALAADDAETAAEFLQECHGSVARMRDLLKEDAGSAKVYDATL